MYRLVVHHNLRCHAQSSGWACSPRPFACSVQAPRQPDLHRWNLFRGTYGRMGVLESEGQLSAALPGFSLNVSDSKPAPAAAAPYRGGRSSRARAPMLARLRSTDELYALCEACAARGNKNGAKRHLAAGFIPVESAVPQSRLIVLICADSSIQLANWCQ